MKKKIKYGILTLFLICGLYFFLRLFYGIFTPYNFWTANQDIKKGKIQIVTLGEPFMPQLENKLASKYGFQFNNLGCVITKELLNGANNYNNQVIKHLEKKFGIGFWDKFNFQKDSLMRANNIIL